jgi:hypothetical protein
MLEKIKKSWKSWTIWFNGIALAIIAGLPSVQEAVPQLQPYVDAKLYKQVMVAVIAANILLRFKTNKPLEAK